MNEQQYLRQGDYLFGDNGKSAYRLRLLHKVFAESSRAFLSESAPRGSNLAVDIGCGPGHTTRLIYATLKPLTMVGIDSSEALIAEARRYTDGEQYVVHDATVLPFPVGLADILHARFVVTHLEDPAAVIEAWALQITEGGLLLLDEVEMITTSNEVLSKYLNILDSLMSHEGRALYVGLTLSSIQTPSQLEIRRNHVRRLRVQDRHAAAMFRLNLEAWRDRQFIIDTYGAAAVRHLADELEVMARNSKMASTIEWRMRQIVFKRV